MPPFDDSDQIRDPLVPDGSDAQRAAAVVVLQRRWRWRRQLLHESDAPTPPLAVLHRCVQSRADQTFSTPSISLCSRVNARDNIPYVCLVSTRLAKSSMAKAGDGLFAVEYLPPFTWVGFYPGKVTATFNRKRESHTMGTVDNANGDKQFIIADANVKEGVHMINEAGKNIVANVWYAKLPSGYVLYFTGREVHPREELLTCYSRSYGKRCYPVPVQCSDPRCMAAEHSHRYESSLLEEWMEPLLKTKPLSLALPPDFLR